MAWDTACEEMGLFMKWKPNIDAGFECEDYEIYGLHEGGCTLMFRGKEISSFKTLDAAQEMARQHRKIVSKE